MPFDAVNLSVLTKELNQKLTGARINKITQPEKDEIVLNVFNGQNMRLSISASGALPRIHLTDVIKPNPDTAPAFCMALRKHLTGGRIDDVFQQPFERVIILKISSSSELGDSETKFLICEVVGKSANVFLTDGQYKIIDCLKRLPLNSLADRPTMTGQTFEFLKQDKTAPDDYEKIARLLSENMTLDAKEILKNKLMGVGFSTLEEMTAGATQADEIIKNFKAFFKKLEDPLPTLVSENGVPKDVTAIDYVFQTGEKQRFESLNQAYDAYFAGKDKAQRHGEKTRALASIVKNAVRRTEKKISIQTQALLDAQDNEINKIYGEIILSNLYRMKKGDEKLIAENFYDGTTVEIALDPLCSPQQNAQKLFKKYTKQKKTVEYTKQLLDENKQQLLYLKSIAQSLNSPLDAHDIDDITEELQNARLIKKPQTKGKQKAKISRSKPLTYKIDGWTVLAGKNNLQNDRLTFETAKANDLWLHTQDVTSCHTIILNPHNADIPDGVVQTAAEITAFYSEAGTSTKVSVFYTPKKYVKKPNKSPLGFVNILQYKTCVVDPAEHADLLTK